MKIVNFLTLFLFGVCSLIAYTDHYPDPYNPPDYITMIDFDLTDPPDFVA